MADIEPPTQDNRTAKLATPFGKDKLCLVRLEGHEAIGELFEFRVEAVSTEANIDFDPQLGQNCSVHLDTEDGVGRDFSGVLTEARWVGRRFDLYVYRLVLRPWPWLLTLRAQCRIFKDKTPKQIIREALGDGKYGPIDDSRVKESYSQLEYTVQYRETDLNFALRLMEKWGVYFYFDFDKGDGSSVSGHRIVLSDQTSVDKLPAPDSIILAPYASSALRKTQRLRDWTKVQGMVPGLHELTDYDYLNPNASMLKRKEEPYPYDHGRSLVFDYTGGYDVKGHGEQLTRVRNEADRRGALSHAGGYAPSLIPGYKIKRTSTDDDPLDGEYLIRHCTHWYGDEAYNARGDATAAGPGYDGRYEFSQSSIPYRMPLRSRRPIITGTQPALVIRDEKNAAGEEIDVDKHGRIYVRFYWDVLAKEVLARRIRVAQVWAGKTRGMLFTPRVGDEVVVAYEDGDPDRPIVVGSVYNGENTVPMQLPDKKVKSGLLTMSSKGGGGYNMLLFDDTKGDEHVKLRSEKDLMFKALNNEQRDILNSQTENIGQDETINVGFPSGSGNFTLNALQTVTINVGMKGSPMTQIKMDTSSITLNVGPGGTLAQIKMDASGVTISATPASRLMVQPSGITTMTPTLLFGIGPATFTSQVTIPIATIGAGTVGPLPLI